MPSAAAPAIWRNRRFQAYALGLMIDRLGNAFYAIALPLLMYHLTQSVTAMGLMAILQFVPRFVGGPLIGSVVDRFSRRRIIVAALLFQSLCSLLLAVLVQQESLPLWVLYLLGALTSIGFEFSRTAEIAVVPVMFGRQRVAATAALASIHTAMFMLGPVLAGILLSFSGYNTLFFLNAFTYLAPVILCIWSRIPDESNLGGINGFTQMKQAVAEGLVHIRRNPSLLALMQVTLLITLATGGIETMIIFHLKDNLGFSDTLVSYMLASSTLGMFLGTLVAGHVSWWERGQLLAFSLAAAIAGLILFLSARLVMMLLAQCILSMGIFSFSVLRDIIVQDLTPGHLMGRVGGLVRMLMHASLPLSTALLAAITEWYGISVTFIVIMGSLLIALVMVFLTPLMRLAAPERYVRDE